MSHDRNNPDRERSPSFGEGPLPPDVVTDLHRLRDFVRARPVPEPKESEWSSVLLRVHACMNQGPARLAGATSAARRAPPRRRWAMLGLAAAAALVAVLLSRSWWMHAARMQAPSPLPAPVEEPFLVAEAEDVNILAIDANDLGGLVVGEPPVSGELIFASMEDVRVVECMCCPKSGNIAKLERGEVPMLVATVARVDTPHGE